MLTHSKALLKKTLVYLLVLSLLLLSACGKKPAYPTDSVSSSEATEQESTEQTTADAETSEETETSIEASVFPMTVTDQAGREVTFEQAPEKIVSGYYISSSALIALGVQSKLVGIEAKADKRNIYKLSAPELCELPSVGSAKEFDLEGCAALKPDLAILPLKLKDAAETLTDLGIKVLLVNPENMELMENMLKLLGAVTERSEQAENICKFIRETDDRLNKLNGEKPVVYMASNSSLLATAGKNMFQSDMIRLAGGKNAAEEIEDTYWADISYEQLVSWNPDVILLAAEASYTVDDVLNDPALSDVTAVKNKQVYAMPDKAEAWDSPVPGAILGSVYLASLLHEDELTEKECTEIIDSFYEEFYGFTYSEK